MKYFAKSLSAILVGALLLTACTSGTSSPTQTPAQTPKPTASAGSVATQTQTPAPEPEVLKPKEIFIVADTMIEEANGAQQVWDHFEQQTGIKLRVIKPDHNEYMQRLELQFVSGDIPDFIEMTSNYYLRYAREGALYPLTDLVASSPRLSQTPQDMLDVLDYKGDIYGIQKEIGNGAITYIREDWMKELNIDMPKTHDEFIQMLRTFVEKDASGTGKTYGYVAPKFESEIYMADWLQDARLAFYKNEQGVWVDGFGEEAMLECLKRIAAAYQEGLIDPDFFTLSTADARSRFYSGNIGAFTYWAGNWRETIRTELQRNIPTANIVPMPAFENVKHINRIAVIYALPVDGAAKNPEGVFKYFMEYLYDGAEGQMWSTHGIEGLTYKVDNGNYVALPALSNPDLERSSPVSPFLTNGLEYLSFPNNPFAVTAEKKESTDIFMSTARTPDLIPAVDAHTRNQASFAPLRAETIAMAATGALTPEEAYARYLKEAKILEVDTILKELNEY